MTGFAAALRNHASLIRLSHTVFALPFAVLALLAATAGRPPLPLLLLVVAAVVAARTAAMAFNRWADRRLDADNPRTAGREIPRGLVTPRAALSLALGAGALFVLVAAAIGPVCGAGAVPVLLWLYGYSYSKRFTLLCHLWLGVALGLAPLAAFVAAQESAPPAGGMRLWPGVVLGAAVATWVAGFDVLYACQDEAFDRERGLRSIPAAFGAARAMAVARLLHVAAAALLLAFGWLAGLRRYWLLGVAAAAVLLLWQHRLLRPGDLRRVATAFFTANGALSLVMLAAGCADLYFG
jgi:4-hydroxybenzoate polyprenyltransferase